MKKLFLIGTFALALAALAAEGTVEVGMTEAKLIELKGSPQTKASLGKKSIYRWPDMQVTLIDGKIDQIQYRDRVAEKVSAKGRAAEGKRTTKAVKGTNTPPLAIVNPPAGGTGKLGVHTMRVAGQIGHVIPDGIILYEWNSLTVEPYGNHYGAAAYQQKLLIVGAPSNLLDGDRYEGVVYLAGRYEYAGSVIHRYATSPALATKLQTSD